MDDIQATPLNTGAEITNKDLMNEIHSLTTILNDFQITANENIQAMRDQVELNTSSISYLKDQINNVENLVTNNQQAAQTDYEIDISNSIKTLSSDMEVVRTTVDQLRNELNA